MDLNNYEPEVRSRLASFLGGSLPYQGILAGPGMAAMLLSILWDREIPVGKLDLYTDWPNEPQEIYEQYIASKPVLNDETFPPVVANGISIICSQSNGNLTNHLIDKHESVFGKDRTLLILHALELNAFGVGYDCYNHKLYTTGEFDDFCSTRQLKIQSPVYAESLILLLKYRKCFDAFVDIKEEISLLIGFRRLCVLLGNTSLYCNLISEESARFFDQFNDEFGHYCTLAIDSAQPVLPGLEPSMGFRYRLLFNGVLKASQFNLDVSDLFKYAELEFDSFSFAVYYKYCVRRGTSNALKRLFMLALSRPVTACMVLYNPTCLHHYFTDKHVSVIDCFYKVHTGCVRMLLGLNLTIFTMAASIQLIKAFAKKNGNLIIGLIETHSRFGYNLKEISWETLEQLLEAYRINAGTPLLENTVNLEAFEYCDCITELTTTTELECEGWKMRHCVGGYAQVLASDQGNTRIFHIDGQKPSTAAIYFNKEANQLTYDLYGVGNCDPTPEHALITEHLGRYLVRTLWNVEDQCIDGDNLYRYAD